MTLGGPVRVAGLLMAATLFGAVPAGAQTCEEIVEDAAADAYDRGHEIGYAQGYRDGGGGTMLHRRLPGISTPFGTGGGTTGHDAPWQLLIDQARARQATGATPDVGELLRAGDPADARAQTEMLMEALRELQLRTGPGGPEVPQAGTAGLP